MTRSSASALQVLAEIRLDDARVLLSAARHSAAYYLAGYAVECAIKAIIARSFKDAVIPDKAFVQRIYSHNLTDLIVLAELKPALDQRRAGSTAFRTNWSVVSNWSEASRYDILDCDAAHAMVEAVAGDDEGVFQWLKER